MATSGSYNFELQRNDIITLAFQLINVYSTEDTPTATDITFASKLLNGMIKVWETEGIHLWKRRLGYLFTALLQHSYELGSVSGADNCTNTYNTTTLSSAAASSATSLSVASASGMAISDNIGIKLDSGTRQWTTISNIVGTTLTIASGLSSAAASGNNIITYTTKLNRPLKIFRATTVDLNTSSKTESTMSLLSYDSYFNLPIKNTVGKPCQFYYDRLLTGTLPYTGTFYIYPEPSDVNVIIAFSYLDSIQDFDSATDTPDLPQEWFYPLAYNLATELAPFYGKFLELEKMQPKADMLKASMSSSDSENSSLYMRIKRW